MARGFGAISLESSSKQTACPRRELLNRALHGEDPPARGMARPIRPVPGPPMPPPDLRDALAGFAPAQARRFQKTAPPDCAGIGIVPLGLPCGPWRLAKYRSESQPWRPRRR